MEVIAHAIDIHIVDQIARAWPRLGVNRRKRKAVDNLEKARAKMYKISLA